MKKIPTLFVRDEDTNRRFVKDEVTEGCEWVLDGEGVPTRKYDGTCVMFNGEDWFARREVKPGKVPSGAFVQVDHDDVTGKTVGWEPAEDSGFYKYLLEAIANHDALFDDGTYELCGPKINGNPEGFQSHVLVEHANADRYHSADDELTFDGLRGLFTGPDFAFEGIVWHHQDGRMVKLKKRDFPSQP